MLENSHPFESQILESKRDSLDRGAFDKGFELYASKKTREPKELVNPEETESNQKTGSYLSRATSSGNGGSRQMS